MSARFARLINRRVWRSKLFAFLASLFMCIAAIPMFSIASSATTTTSVQFVPPSWIAEYSSDTDLRILDVPINPFDYFTAHISNAVHIAENTFRGPNGTLPVQCWETEKLGSLFAEAGVTDNSKVLIYSDGRDVLGTTMVAYLLERSGHGNVVILDGGFAAYKAANLPATKAFPSYTPGQFTV